MRKMSSKEYKEFTRTVGPEKMTQIERDSGYTDTPLQMEPELQPSEQKPEKKATKAVAVRKKDRSEFESNTENIIQLHQQLFDLLSTSLSTALKIGGLLFEQKNIVKHGEFENWVRDHLPFKIRTAQRYMKLYQYKDAIEKEGITSITDAYHHVYRVPVSDDIIEADDSIIIPKSYISVSYEKLDSMDLPKKLKKGMQEKFLLSDLFIDQVVSGDCLSLNKSEGCFSKIVIELCRKEPVLGRTGELIVALEKYMRPGGKIIFYKK